MVHRPGQSCCSGLPRLQTHLGLTPKTQISNGERQRKMVKEMSKNLPGLVLNMLQNAGGRLACHPPP